MVVSIFLSIPSFPGDQRLVRELGATKGCGKAGLRVYLEGQGHLVIMEKKMETTIMWGLGCRV